MWNVEGAVWAVTASVHDVQVLCGLFHPLRGLLHPLRMIRRRCVGCHSLYVGCCRRRVGFYFLYE